MSLACHKKSYSIYVEFPNFSKYYVTFFWFCLKINAYYIIFEISNLKIPDFVKLTTCPMRNKGHQLHIAQVMLTQDQAVLCYQRQGRLLNKSYFIKVLFLRESISCGCYKSRFAPVCDCKVYQMNVYQTFFLKFRSNNSQQL